MISIKDKTGFLSFSSVLVSAAIPIVAYSQVYLTEDQALTSIFPGEKFERKAFPLSPEDVRAIEQQGGETVRTPSLLIYVGTKKNVVFVDQVLGKHEFITFAVGITKERKVQSIEILEYRETFGYQVAQKKWRDQFVGKDITSTLELNKDITNLSGATLSSSHLTKGVKRLLSSYEIMRGRI